MKLREITSFLESLAPLAYQEDYDNSGLIVGHPDKEITGALISLDCTESVVDEAIQQGLSLIISHHPIVFKGLKKFNGKSYVERVVMKAIKHDIALYAIHTNLDHVSIGVNKKICDKLGIKNSAILKPREASFRKLVTFCPEAHAEALRAAMFRAGAGNIGNYSECSYNASGLGTFKGGEGSNPFVGEPCKQHHESEIRIETIYPVYLEQKILAAIYEAHPYEEPAYDLYPINNSHPQVGSGMIGNLESDSDELDFLNFVKERLGAKVIRHTALRSKKIRRVAVCGGSGSFLLPQALSAGADIFITGDFKYHEFFDAEGKLIIADVGHFESEQFTQELLLELITEKFSNFALRLTVQNTNPINYLI
ncbi:MAG: Nif3-like dinuclear metal center hexameric protein [Daejeonella sp.]|uniref:Nif3-like dinuclear metal center hexameric protein n=1 Tax=Daejeonella sp. TaxID=2805397 RepID=UPI00273403AC|nr:Nif3-like dinuclear metal center hexameric protein [Daejeonella sp.]MDP3467112.1 Nif3-like dinuclear metal center hexameric protein [Daejeonella sp.]